MSDDGQTRRRSTRRNACNAFLVVLALASFVAGIVLSAISAKNINCAYAGVAMVFVCAVTTVVVVVRVKNQKGACACCSCHCTCYCFHRCCRHKPQHSDPETPDPDRIRLDFLRHHVTRHQQNTTGADHSLPPRPNPVESVPDPGQGTLQSQYRILENEIQQLFRLLSEIQGDLVEIPRLARDMLHLQNEFNRVGSWIEGVISPTTEDMDKVGLRLSKINRNILRYRRRLSRDPFGYTIDLRTGRRLNRALSPPEVFGSPDSTISSMYSMSMTSPPNYNLSRAALPAYTEIDTSASVNSTLNSQASLIPRRLRPSRSTYSLAPPAEGFDAPPAYDEAVASPV